MSRQAQPPKLAPFQQAGRAAVWTVFYRDGSAPRRWSTGIPVAGADEKRRAAAAFEQWQKDRAAQARSFQGPSDPAAVTVSEVIADYVRFRSAKVVDKQRLVLCARPLAYFFANDTMASLTPVRIEAYEAWRRSHGVRVVDKRTGEIEIVTATTSDGTLIRELAGFLSAAIRYAVTDTQKLKDGIYKVPRPTTPPSRDRWLTVGEAARLLREACAEKQARLHLPYFILLALYTGQRRGAILDLKWTQIDFVNRRIDFNPPGRTQTKKHRPIVPIPDKLLPMLRRLHARASSEYVIAINGNRVTYINQSFTNAARDAGLVGVSPHTLRHTAGTWMAQHGVPLWEVAGYLGHSNERTTELYAHHSPDYRKSAATAMSRRRAVG
jgi:integrase